MTPSEWTQSSNSNSSNVIPSGTGSMALLPGASKTYVRSIIFIKNAHPYSAAVLNSSRTELVQWRGRKKTERGKQM